MVMAVIPYTSIMHTRNPDGTYGPNKKGHCYIPASYHSRKASSSPYKTKWCIPEPHEYCVFVYADVNDFVCSKNNCLFAIINDCKTKLGDNGERVAKFPIPKGETPYHGYPVHGEGIDEDLLDKWEKSTIISRPTRRRLAKCQI